MIQFWRHMVDVIRVLLECTAALVVTRTCTSSVEMWWEKRNLDIHVGAHGVEEDRYQMN